MKNFVLISFLILFSIPVFGESKHITPADKEKISRHAGESVFVECKNQSPFSTNCQVDCGNGFRYRTAKGYCHYLAEGKYVLSVSTRYRGQDITHTALVSVDINEASDSKVADERPIIEKKAAPSILPVANSDEPSTLPSNIAANPSLSPSKTAVAIPGENDSTQDFNKGILNAPSFSASELQQNNFQDTASGINLDVNNNTISDQGNFGQLNNQFNNGIIQNTSPPGNAISNNAENFNNQNQFNNQN